MEMIRNNEKQSYHLAISSSIILVGFFASVVFHYIMGVYFKLPYPYSTFLFNPDDVFNDFKNMYYITKDFSPYVSSYWFSSIYFPFANIIFWIFTVINNVEFSLIVFLSSFGICYGIGIKVVSKKILKMTFIQKVSIFLIAYPMLFALDRANIEIFVFLFVGLFVYFYFYKSNYILAAIFLGLAISMKLYPGVFILFFLRDKKFKQLIVLLIVCVLVSFIPLLIFKGGFTVNLRQMLANMRNFSSSYNGVAGLQHNNTLYGLLCISFYGFAVIFRNISFSDLTSLGLYEMLMKPYLILVIILFLLIVLFIIKTKMRDSLAYLLLTVCMIIFPNISYDYKLIFIIPALIFYIKNIENEMPNKFTNAVIILINLLLIPKDYIVIIADVTSNVLLNSIIFIVIMFLVGYLAIKENRQNIKKVSLSL